MNTVFLKRVFLLVVVLGIIISGTSPEAQADNGIAGQVVLQVDFGIPVETVIDTIQGIVFDSIIDIRTFLVNFPEIIPLDSVLLVLGNNPHVSLVQPNYILGVPETNQISQSFPDQNRPPYLKGESPPDYYEQPGTYTVGIDSAGLLSQGDNVVVAVIDNGLDFSHPLFDTSNLMTGYDFVDDDNDPSEISGDSTSMYGHGTFVSGIILLTAPHCRILPLRAFDETGQGNSFAVVEAIYAAIDSGAQVINMSFGMEVNNPLMQLAIEDAYNAGIVMVASAGNDSSSVPMYPAAYPEVLAVSAIDTLETIAGFSNYGDYIHLCAPGVNIYSALPGQYQWGTWSGTSFAAPFVSGAIALAMASPVTVSGSDMFTAVNQTARTSLLWGEVTPPSPLYGNGCLDVYNLVLAWSRGDIDNSHEIDVADLSYYVDFLFTGGPPPVVSFLLGDVTCDSDIKVDDLTLIVNYLFTSGSGNWPCSY